MLIALVVIFAAVLAVNNSLKNKAVLTLAQNLAGTTYEAKYQQSFTLREGADRHTFTGLSSSFTFHGDGTATCVRTYSDSSGTSSGRTEPITTTETFTVIYEPSRGSLWYDPWDLRVILEHGDTLQPSYQYASDEDELTPKSLSYPWNGIRELEAPIDLKTIVDSLEFRDYANLYSGGSSNKGDKCIICNGTGYVRYNYGSSDLEALLDGEEPFTTGPCTCCGGSGRD